MTARRPPTATSAFGVGRRENHDASAFYERFRAPALSTDETVNPPGPVDEIWCHDARDMGERVKDASVALVVTSPPYFAGKEYEESLGQNGVPASYRDYLQLLTDVFAECARKLEPGGRIAVNVANLGRKPYRSLSADVITILQDELGLLLRGEVIWQKAEGASGSCAWGSYQSATNPVLRDVTERVVIASKGRFSRAVRKSKRAAAGLPHADTISADDFAEATLDLWRIPPESATRVGHPAPFPVALPRRLIELYTFRDDLVLDPFMGSGSTAVAAVRTGRHYVGFDTDRGYVTAARRRVEAELARRSSSPPPTRIVVASPAEGRTGDPTDFQAKAVAEGRKAKEIAEQVLVACGFEVVGRNVKVAHGVEVNLVCRDQQQRRWLVDVSGAFTSTRGGLRRTDTLWKALGRAAVLSQSDQPSDHRLLLLTTDLPPRHSAGDAAIRAVRGRMGLVFDAVEMLSPEGQERLQAYARGDDEGEPLEPYLPGNDSDVGAFDAMRQATLFDAAAGAQPG